MALLDCAEAAVYLNHMLSEASGCSKRRVVCRVDNKSLVDALYSSHLIEDKRLRIDMALMKDMIGKKDVSEVMWVDSSQQLANCLTKRGASTESLRNAVSSD